MGEERSRLLICIGISMLIWILMKLSAPYSTNREVALDYLLPPMMEFTEVPPGKMTATVEGSGFNIIGNYLRAPSPSIEVDLRENTGREFQREEILSSIQRKLGLTVSHLSRNNLDLSVDSMLFKKVPVRLETDLKFQPDFFPIGEPILSIDSVFVSGTPELLSQISEVSTELITCPPANSSLTRIVKIIPQENGRVQVTPSEIEVNIEVEQFTEKKFKLPVGIPTSQDSIQLIPNEVEVKCVVALNRYADLSGVELILEADLEDKTVLGNQNAVPVKVLKMPPWVRGVDISPPVVEFFIVQ